MPTILQRPSRTATAAIYDEVQALVARTAYRFSRRYGVDGEDALGDANLHFFEALQGHDPDKGGFERRLTAIIWNRLLDQHRIRARHNARIGVIRADADLDRFGRSTPDRDDLDDALDTLGRDAREVVRLLFRETAGLDDAIRKAKPHRRGIKLALKRHLAERGWDRTRIQTAFDEISEVLS